MTSRSASPRQLEPRELAQLGSVGDGPAEPVVRIALVLDPLPLESPDVGERELGHAACETLAEGNGDQRRATTAARLLPPEQGTPFPAGALPCSDAPVSGSARVVDVLAAFRDVDKKCTRRPAALAEVPETACSSEPRPERVVELAHTVRQLATR